MAAVVVAAPIRSRDRFAVLIWVVVGLVCACCALIASAGTATLALGGQSAPGTGGATYASFLPIDLALSRYSAFTSSLGNTTPSMDRAMFLAEGTSVRLVVREGRAATSGGGTFADFGPPGVHEFGSITFGVNISGGDRATYRAAPTNVSSIVLTQVARAPAGAGSMANMSDPAVATDGAAYSAFRSDDGSPAVQQIHRINDNNTLQRVAHSGAADLAGGGTVNFGTFGFPTVSGGGTVAFLAQANMTERGIFATLDGSTFTRVARTGAAAPGGGTFNFLSDPVTNEAGTLAFGAAVPNQKGIWRGSSEANLTLIAKQSQPAPGGGTFVDFDQERIAREGHVAFRGSSTSSTGRDIWRTGADGTGLALIARVGQTAPGGGGTMTALSEPALAPGGQLAYRAQLAGAGTNAGIYITDGTETLLVNRTGQALAGSTVVNLDSSFGAPPASGRTPVNLHGQVLYWASLADGKQGVFLFTPELHWRGGTSGSFDSPSNWTLGLEPAFVHDVFVTPASVPVSVSTAPFVPPVVVKSLTLGGAGAHLRSTTTLVTFGPISIAPGSRLELASGSASVRDVLNNGTFESATSVSMGRLDGTGLTRVSAGSVTLDRARQGALEISGSTTTVFVRANGGPHATPRGGSISNSRGARRDQADHHRLVD